MAQELTDVIVTKLRRAPTCRMSVSSIAICWSKVLHNDEPLHRDTVRAYLDALERVFVLEDQPAWSARLRSRSRLRRSSKRHFVDPSLAVADSVLDANVSGGTSGSWACCSSRWQCEIFASTPVPATQRSTTAATTPAWTWMRSSRLRRVNG